MPRSQPGPISPDLWGWDQCVLKPAWLPAAPRRQQCACLPHAVFRVGNMNSLKVAVVGVFTAATWAGTVSHGSLSSKETVFTSPNQHLTGVGTGTQTSVLFEAFPCWFHCVAKFENQWSRHGDPWRICNSVDLAEGSISSLSNRTG